MRQVRTSEKWFVAALVAMLAFVLLHDWVPLGPLNDISGIRAEKTIRELILITVLNGLSFSVVLAIALVFYGKPYPLWARLWLVIHLFCIIYGAASAWWIPYFFGTTPEMVQSYATMFGNTHAFLPVRNGIVPNTIHTVFHFTLLSTWVLSLYLAITAGRQHTSRQHDTEHVHGHFPNTPY